MVDNHPPLMERYNIHSLPIVSKNTAILPSTRSSPGCSGCSGLHSQRIPPRLSKRYNDKSVAARALPSRRSESTCHPHETPLLWSTSFTRYRNNFPRIYQSFHLTLKQPRPVVDGRSHVRVIRVIGLLDDVQAAVNYWPGLTILALGCSEM